MKLFEVKTKCGHVGRKYYALKSFAVKAENGREAAEIARSIPRVKHDHKDAIVDVQEVNYFRYAEIIELNKLDPYFKCHNVQEQRSYSDPDIYPEAECTVKVKMTDVRKQVFKGKTIIRKPRKYIKNYYLEERWAY